MKVPKLFQRNPSLIKSNRKLVYFLLLFLFFVSFFVKADITTGLVAHWKFDEGSGSVAQDSSGSGNNATLVNGPAWTSGKIGQALSFDGTDDYVQVSNAIVGTGTLTFCTWFRVSSITASTHYFIGYSYPFRLAFTSNGGSLLYAYLSNDNAVFAQTPENITLNAWHHLCVVRLSNNTASFYVDGSLSGAANQNVGTVSAGYNFIISGRGGEGGFIFNGLLDDYRIYNRALSASDITELYNNTGGTPPTPDIQAPTIPTNLTATAVSSSQINLTRTASTDNVGVAGYRIYRGGSQIGTTESTAYSNTGLSPSTTYTYTVAAYDAAGNISNQSTSASATTSTTQSSGEIISANRRVTWEGNVGVTGGIPNRTTICATINAATYGNSTTDATTAIQNALNSCSVNQVVYLPTGTYRTTGTIIVPSNRTLRGAGMGQTIIKNSSGVTYLVGYSNNPDSSLSQATARDIVSGNTEGSTSITTSVAHGWNVGDIILIDQLEDPTGDPPIDSTGIEGECLWCGRSNGARPIGQLVKLVAPTSGTTATLEIPLTKAFNRTPQGIKLNGITSNAGVEDLTLDSSSACANANYGVFSDMYTDNCWISNVEIIRPCRTGLQLYGAYRNTIRGVKIHESQNHVSNGGYGLWMIFANSSNLIEDSIFYNLVVGIIYNGSVSGNVFAYNYITRVWSDTYPGRGWLGLGSHGSEPWMNLFEGNYIDGPVMGGDFAWGSAAFGTYFRNRQKTDITLSVNQLYGTVFMGNDRYHNMVGNVLGTVGYETIYESNDLYNGQKGIYYLQNSTVANSIYRHGNWDSVHNGVVWDTGNSNHTLPASLYLSSRPSWWGTLSWPPIGPDLSPMTGTIPAKQRYDAIMGGDTTPPAAPTGVSVN